MSGEEKRVLEGYLRERGQKMTEPRETVLEAFLKLERHVTAEELLAAARKIDPSIGQATVFRAIKLFAEAGLAREACPDEGAKRYEHAYRHEHHDHLVCLGCGAIVEFKDPGIERAQEAIYRKYGYRPSGHQMELQGYCPACAKKAGAVDRR
jgi:Fur family transcriptional regulator, ferric uptake regulator